MKTSQPPRLRRRRQLGSDRRVPLPAVPAVVSERKVALGRIAVFASAVAWLCFGTATIWRVATDYQGPSLHLIGQSALYLVVMSLLTCSSIAYLTTRVGAFERWRAHRRTPRAFIEAAHGSGEAQPLTVLVPSYREEMRVVRNTLLSAALQEYPSLRIVLLVDDPPHPRQERNRELLESARALPHEVEALLAQPFADAQEALERFELTRSREGGTTLGDLLTLADDYGAACAWLERLADGYEVVDHIDAFLVDQVLRKLAADLDLVSAALRSAADEGTLLPEQRLRELHERLVWTFRAELTSFERKRYASLSSEPNKAMNLNSYIGLMGGAYQEEATPVGLVLRPCDESDADLVVPGSELILTLDADSVLLPEYVARLVFLLEQPENERVGVIQTPYSAYPGSTSRIERIAGASTDLQHIVHQGMTYYGATFWVGANAIMRRAALLDIEERDQMGGYEIHRYIHDRTPIEDTESSVDLRIHGWELVNYPERLSYSATPPDFGSLCIQRRRWADGGLIVLPKLWRQWRAERARGQRVRLPELFLRINYMASIAWSNAGLVLLLALPYTSVLPGVLVLLAALPYFLATSADLKSCGYRRLDVLRVYGFNLILVPVNLAGVLRSLGQAITGQKIPFARTPKVRNRTTASLPFVVVPYLLVGFLAVTAVHYFRAGQWQRGTFAVVNCGLASYAILAFIGLKDSVVDIFANIVKHLYRPVQQPAAPVALDEHGEPVLDWAAVLHYGEAQLLPQTPPPPAIGERVAETPVSEPSLSAAGRRR